MPQRFHPPPNWPASPEGWQPRPGWRPDPAWGPPPYGWALWRDEAVEGDGGGDTAHGGSLIAVYAVLIGVGIAISVFSTRFGLASTELSAIIGFSPATAALPIHRFLVGKRTRRSVDEVALAVGFRKPWWIVLLLGSTLYFVALQATGFITGLIWSLEGQDPNAVVAALDVAVIIMTLTWFPLVGYWIGLRVGSGVAYLLPPLIGVLGQTGGMLLTAAVISGDDPVYASMQALLNPTTTVSALVTVAILGATTGIPFVLVGRRNRASQHTAWLTKKTDRIRRQRSGAAPAHHTGAS